MSDADHEDHHEKMRRQALELLRAEAPCGDWDVRINPHADLLIFHEKKTGLSDAVGSPFAISIGLVDTGSGLRAQTFEDIKRTVMDDIIQPFQARQDDRNATSQDF